MSKKAFDQKLDNLDAIRADPASPASLAALRKALTDSGFLAAKAATLAGEAGLKELLPDLLAAFDRFFVNPQKSDPQCWAKNALAKALKDLEHDDSPAFVRGLMHVQFEPVWGGQADSAATLRATCALALSQCRDLSDLQILTHLTNVLCDAQKRVRMDAARAVSQLGRDEGGLLLRLKALAGDIEPEVTGACLSSLIGLNARDGISFAARFLDAPDRDVQFEAAAALGECREPAAFEILREHWERTRDRELRRAILASMGASRQPEAIQFLLRLIGGDSAEDALLALAPNRFFPEILAEVKAAVERADNSQLQRIFEERFVI